MTKHADAYRPGTQAYRLRHNYLARSAPKRARRDATVVHDVKTAAGLGYTSVEEYDRAIRTAKLARTDRRTS